MRQITSQIKNAPTWCRKGALERLCQCRWSAAARCAQPYCTNTPSCLTFHWITTKVEKQKENDIITQPHTTRPPEILFDPITVLIPCIPSEGMNPRSAWQDQANKR